MNSLEEKEEKVSKGNLSLGKKIAAVISCLSLIVAIFVFTKWMHYRYTHAVTNNAFVRTDMIEVSPLVPGHIKKIFVDEGDRIKKGQLLAIIDADTYKANVNLSRAQKVQAEKQVEKVHISIERLIKESSRVISIAERGINKAREDVKKANINLRRVERDYYRHKKLIKNKIVSQRLFDNVESIYKAAQADQNVAETALHVCEDQLSRAKLTELQILEAKKDLASLEAAVDTADRALDLALLNYGHTKIKCCCIDGVVAKKHFDEGDFIAPGFPVFSIYDENNVYIEANLEETKSRDVKIGQLADLWVDTYSGKKLLGKVIKVAMAAGGEFSLIPRDLSSGEFTKVVQRIPIKIKVEDCNGCVLRPGMSVNVGIKLNQIN